MEGPKCLINSKVYQAGDEVCDDKRCLFMSVATEERGFFGIISWRVREPSFFVCSSQAALCRKDVITRWRGTFGNCHIRVELEIRFA